MQRGRGWGICFGPASGLSAGQLVPFAREAEARGFESVWTGEFQNDCLAWLQAFAGVTGRCRLGSSIANVFLRHPTVVAAAAAVIDELSDARLILGLGTSHRSIVEEALGLQMHQPLDFLEEYIQVVRATLSGEPVFHRGRYFQVQGFRLGARPVRSEIPVYIATLGLKAAERAGRYADGVMLTLMPSAYIAELVERFRSAATAAGRDPSALEVVHIVPCFFSDDEEAAEMAAREMICRYVQLPFYANMFSRAGFSREVERLRAALAAQRMREAMDAVSVRMVEELAVTGNGTGCSRMVERFRQSGVDSVVLYPNAVDADWEKAIRMTLERVAPSSRH